MEDLITLITALGEVGYTETLDFIFGSDLRDAGIDTTDSKTVAIGLANLLIGNEGIDINSSMPVEKITSRIIYGIIGRVVNSTTAEFRELFANESVDVLFNLASSLSTENTIDKIDDDDFNEIKKHPTIEQLGLKVDDATIAYPRAEFLTSYPAALLELMSLFSNLELDGLIDERTANGLFEPFGITVNYTNGTAQVSEKQYVLVNGQDIEALGWTKDNAKIIGISIRGLRELFLKQTDDAKHLMKKTLKAGKGSKRRPAEVIKILNALFKGFALIYATALKVPMCYLWVAGKDDDTVDIITKADAALTATINKLSRQL